MTLYWCTSTGPTRTPVIMPLEPDVSWDVQPGMIRLVTWPNGERSLTAYVEAESRKDAARDAAALFAQAWREVAA